MIVFELYLGSQTIHKAIFFRAILSPYLDQHKHRHDVSRNDAAYKNGHWGLQHLISHTFSLTQLLIMHTSTDTHRSSLTRCDIYALCLWVKPSLCNWYAILVVSCCLFVIFWSCLSLFMLFVHCLTCASLCCWITFLFCLACLNAVKESLI